MSNDKSDRGDEKQAGKAPTGTDALQKELQREEAEGKDAVGDVSKNRNLGGSSTWETLPESSETDT